MWASFTCNSTLSKHQEVAGRCRKSVVLKSKAEKHDEVHVNERKCEYTHQMRRSINIYIMYARCINTWGWSSDFSVSPEQGKCFSFFSACRHNEFRCAAFRNYSSTTLNFTTSLRDAFHEFLFLRRCVVAHSWRCDELSTVIPTLRTMTRVSNKIKKSIADLNKNFVVALIILMGK